MPTDVEIAGFTDGAPAVWSRNRWVPYADSAYNGWPWCADCGPAAVAACFPTATTEIRTVTTYTDPEEPTTDTGWVAGSAPASYVEDVGGGVETISVSLRRKYVADFIADFGTDFPTTQTVRVEYGVLEVDDLGDPTDFSEGNVTVALTPAQEDADTGWITVDAPTVSGRERGITGPNVPPRLLIRANPLEARSYKEGFYEYTRPSSPPEVYATETAEGSRTVCAALEIAAADYDGAQELDADGNFVADTRTADALADGYYSEPRGRRNPGQLDLGWTSLSPTVLVRDRPFACEGSPAVDEVTLTLSDAIATATIQAAVDAIAGGTLGAASAGDTAPARVLSYRRTSADETVYRRRRTKWRVEADWGHIPGGGVYALEVAASIGFTATQDTVTLATGAITTAAVTGTCVVDGSGFLAVEASDRTADAAEGYLIRVHSLAPDAENAIAVNPLVYAHTQAAIAYP